MICPKCGTENNYYHRFCYECGAALQDNINLKEKSQDDELEVPAPIVFNNGNDEAGFLKNRIFRIILSAAIVVVASLGILIVGTNLFKNGTMVNTSDTSPSLPVTAPLASNMSMDTASPKATPTATPTALPQPISLELITPASGNDSTEDNKYLISFKTNGSTILVNDVQVSATSDDKGNMSFYLDLTKYGENSFTIKVEDKYNQEEESTVVINRLMPPTELNLSENQILTTVDNKITVKGKTTANASLAIVTELSYKSPTKVDSDGYFSIDFSLPIIPGQYNVEIKASASDYRDTTLSCVIEKLIDEKAYQKAAVACKFDTLTSNPDYYKGKIIYFSGIVDALETDNNKKFTFLIDKKTEQKVFVEYTGATQMINGAARRLYGEYVDSYNGIPHILVRMGFKISSDPWESIS